MIDAGTEFVGVIGSPVRHSLSPAIHNTAYDALGINWRCGAFEVASPDVALAIQGARALGFRGLAVTMPHKEAAARAAEQLTARAELLRSANTITYRAGVAVAESTDGEGLIDDLREHAAFDPTDATCAVIGAGGAARSVILALAEHGARSIAIVNRTLARAEDAARLAPKVAKSGTIESIGDVQLVVNATPLGMQHLAIASSETSSNTAHIDLHQIAANVGSGQLVVDLVYWPERTEFLDAAAGKGARIRGGLGMLIAQAARQVELWCGEQPPKDVMFARATEVLAERNT